MQLFLPQSLGNLFALAIAPSFVSARSTEFPTRLATGKKDKNSKSGIVFKKGRRPTKALMTLAELRRGEKANFCQHSSGLLPQFMYTALEPLGTNAGSIAHPRRQTIGCRPHLLCRRRHLGRKIPQSSLFPAQIAFGATWNRDLLYDVAVAADNDSRIPVSTTALESSPAPRGAQSLTGTNLGLNRSADPTLSPRSTATTSKNTCEWYGFLEPTRNLSLILRSGSGARASS
ncbi:hypothetical protein NliqN6_6247 [Naganishia liquefaciens]|uniref:Uncharacterized protein n=1 Tax=Naganishia liquefaciens TaxID=104408 RepID=A0A8H3YHD0_9TREE|nr:hypothetical protein NliqN6_6247 [Naganishia liquefaciens]